MGKDQARGVDAIHGRRRARWRYAAAAVLAVALVPLLSAGFQAGDDAGSSNSAAVTPPGAVSFADVVERVSPAVVNIAVTRSSRPTAEWRERVPGGDEFERFFRRFFDGPGVIPDGPRFPRQMRGAGSGFVVDSAGYIATNQHVIEGAEEIVVTLQSGEQLEAEVIGQDERTDLALIRIDAPDGLTALEFGDSDRARVGEWVLAIGNPFGLGGTATAGIISARGRDIRSGPYDDFLQIDAPTNSGNSGGPVFNTAGEVIGVNTAIYSPNGGSIGIGFAIPANQAGEILDELREQGFIERGWLGVRIRNVDRELAESLGLDAARGALIAMVEDDSPADEAGLLDGDVVTEFDGEPVDSSRTLSRLVGSSDSEDEVSIRVWRDGDSLEFTVQLGELSSA